MMRMRNLLTVAAALLAGCAAYPPSPAPDADAQARLFKPVADKAVVYILRDRGDLFIREVRVALDGRDVGATLPNTYMRLELDPGKHEIVSFTDPPASLEINTQPGGLYYVWQDITPERVREHSALRVVDHTTARLTLTTATIVQPK
jgi:hypothetical protein